VARSPRAVEAAQRAAQCDQRVRNVADQLGIGALLDRLPSQLSDGQRQRAALGRAMVRRPSVYLMDEPLTGLDAPLRNQLRRDLKEWHRTAGATVVYVTHDQTEALMLGDRVAVLNEGELQQVGSPRDVYERPGNQFVARFIGNPAMNLIEGRLADGEREGASTFQARAWSLKVPDETLRQHGGRQVVLGIRPEHVIASIGPAGREPAGKEPAGKEVESGCGGEAPPAAQTIEVSGVVRFTESAGDVHWAYVEPVADSSAPAPQCLSSVPQADCLTAKWRPDEQPRSGDVVRLSLNCRRFHWFDAASGANLTLPQSR
jgi:multiple sugar transport system ATP-binding protein